MALTIDAPFSTQQAAVTITESTTANIITASPTSTSPTNKPTNKKTSSPTVSPFMYCEIPVTKPLCPLLTKIECCRPMCTWDTAAGRCKFVDEDNDKGVEWLGEFEVGQTHVIKAVNEKRLAPKIIAHREAELLFTPDSGSRSFTPLGSAFVRVALYSSSGSLVGVMPARPPAKQRTILEQHLSLKPLQDYSDSIWSATLPYNWVEEGNVVLISCINDSKPKELLIKRLELTGLAQFSEHTITR